MSEIILAENQTPSNPSTGFRSFHLNSSNVWVMLNSAGVATPFTTKTDVEIRDLIAAMIQTSDTALSFVYNSGLGQFVISIVDGNLSIASSQVTGTNLANGLVKLDGSAFIPSSLLPGFVDDVLEFANLAAFPVTGETGKLYVAIDTNRTYRWSGTIYVATEDGGVNSFNTRTGVVTAQAGDYTAAQVTFTATGNIVATNAQTAIAELDTEKQDQIATGYTVATTLAAVAATDTILAALGKLQYQQSLVQRKALTGALLNSSNVTLTSMSTLAVNVVAGKTYSFEAKISFQSVATTTGIVLTMTTVTAVGTLSALATIPIAADSTTAVKNGHINTVNDLVVGTATPVINQNFMALIRGTFICTTGGQLLPAFRSEINGSQVTVSLGSTMLIQEMVSV